MMQSRCCVDGERVCVCVCVCVCIHVHGMHVARLQPSTPWSERDGERAAMEGVQHVGR